MDRLTPGRLPSLWASALCPLGLLGLGYINLRAALALLATVFSSYALLVSASPVSPIDGIGVALHHSYIISLPAYTSTIRSYLKIGASCLYPSQGCATHLS